MTAGETPRILLVTEVYPPQVGGSGALLQNVYSRIDGVDVEVWTPVAGAEATGARRMTVSQEPIVGHFWGVREPAAWRQHLRLTRRMLTAHRQHPMVVHCGRAQPEGIPAMIAARLGGPPFLFWVHGEEVTTALTSREFAWTMRRVHRAAALAVANSRNSASVLESVGFPPDRIRVVYPGVDTNRFHPAVDGASIRRQFAAHDEILLLSVGRLQRRKGHDRVIEALHLLGERAAGLRYVVVGDGSERALLAQRVAERGLSDRVQFAGEVPAARLPEYFAAADIFLLPTRVDAHDFEGFGLVFLEAAAAGRPSIGGRGGGVGEAIDHDVTGLLVDGNDASDIARAIGLLAHSSELRRRLGDAARARVVERFTWEAAARAVMAIHLELAR